MVQLPDPVLSVLNRHYAGSRVSNSAPSATHGRSGGSKSNIKRHVKEDTPRPWWAGGCDGDQLLLKVGSGIDFLIVAAVVFPMDTDEAVQPLVDARAR